MTIEVCDRGQQPPPIGAHHGIPFEVYRQWDAINVSLLKAGLKSEKHLAWKLRHPDDEPDTTDRRLGRAIHCRLLEPERFKTDFEVANPCESVFKSGDKKGHQCGAPPKFKVRGEWRCGRHAQDGATAPDDFLMPEEGMRLEAIASSVKKHPVVKLLRQHGGAEASFVWEQDGVLMKSRLDKWIPGTLEDGNCPPTIIDLKKVQSGKGTYDDCQRAIANYSYHIQAAAYVAAVEAVYETTPNFIWLFVEDDAPYDLNVIQANRETLGLGLDELKILLDRYKRVREQPDLAEGYTQEIRLGGLPKWYFRKWHDEHFGGDDE